MIRYAEIKDAELLRDIMYENDKLHSGGRPDLFNPAEKKSCEEIISLIKNDDKEFYVYEKTKSLSVT